LVLAFVAADKGFGAQEGSAATLADTTHNSRGVVLEELNTVDADLEAITAAIVTPKDRIMRNGWDYSPIVLSSHKLILFTIPKAGCTVIKQLARRMMGFSDWQRGDDEIPHNPSVNGLRYLRQFSENEATEMMTSNDWTKAVFVRDAHSRILSAYLDKAVKNDYVKRHCGHQPSSFGEFVKMTCKDTHWAPQRSFIDDKWWPSINFVGHLETAAADMEQLLRRVGAWEQYGTNGWGSGAIFESNSLKERATNADKKNEDYYNERLWQMVLDQEGDPYCPPTTSIKLLNGSTFQSLTFEQKHSVLRPKVQNGDEYYADSGDGTKGMSVLDLGNGRYQIQNATTPVRIWLQYTCGVGKRSPPYKRQWTDGGALGFPRHVFWLNITVVPNTPTLQPVTAPISMPPHAEIVSVGDSLMRQWLFRDDGSPRHPNTRFKLVQAPLLPSTVQTRFLDPLKRLCTQHPFTRDTIIILNSGVWDVLEDRFDPRFGSHGKALRQLLYSVSERYPMAKIVWKGMTAMHIHRVRCDTERCRNRVKYMSSSRASMLNQLQRELVANTSALFIPMYEATLTEARHSRTNDGCHYDDTMNARLWSQVWSNTSHRRISRSVSTGFTTENESVLLENSGQFNSIRGMGGVFGGLAALLICVFFATRSGSSGAGEPTLTPKGQQDQTRV
jgi:hypothetical protein